MACSVRCMDTGRTLAVNVVYVYACIWLSMAVTGAVLVHV
jgi:hypothetical protein